MTGSARAGGAADPSTRRISADPNLVTVLLWLTLMTVIILPQITGEPIEHSQWIIVGCLSGIAGDVAKFVNKSRGSGTT